MLVVLPSLLQLAPSMPGSEKCVYVSFAVCPPTRGAHLTPPSDAIGLLHRTPKPHISIAKWCLARTAACARIGLYMYCLNPPLNGPNDAGGIVDVDAGKIVLGGHVSWHVPQPTCCLYLVHLFCPLSFFLLDHQSSKFISSGRLWRPPILVSLIGFFVIRMRS